MYYNDLYDRTYGEPIGFLSNFGQVTRCVAIHGVHNEEAIDRNTEAIIEQTEMQQAESDESQVQFSGHSMMLERESNESQALFKTESDETQEVITTQGTNIQKAITSQTKTFKDESDETQGLLSAHTNAMKDEAASTRTTLADQGTAIKNAISAQTNTMKSESDETQTLLTNKLQGIIAELNGIKDKVDNAGIKQAIEALEMVNNNYNYNTNNNYNN